jgi:N-methylhydantoinase B
LESKFSGLVLAAGESVRMETPGGGGFGEPAGRAPDALAADLADGIVTEAAALRDYGPALVDQARALLNTE